MKNKNKKMQTCFKKASLHFFVFKGSLATKAQPFREALEASGGQCVNKIK